MLFRWLIAGTLTLMLTGVAVPSALARPKAPVAPATCVHGLLLAADGTSFSQDDHIWMVITSAVKAPAAAAVLIPSETQTNYTSDSDIAEFVLSYDGTRLSPNVQYIIRIMVTDPQGRTIMYKVTPLSDGNSFMVIKMG